MAYHMAKAHGCGKRDFPRCPGLEEPGVWEEVLGSVGRRLLTPWWVTKPWLRIVKQLACDHMGNGICPGMEQSRQPAGPLTQLGLFPSSPLLWSASHVWVFTGLLPLPTVFALFCMKFHLFLL